MEAHTLQREILVTNGLGSYSLMPVDHVRFRKYHGLFTVSKQPPVDRVHVLSDMRFEVSMDGLKWHHLATPEVVSAAPYPIATESWHYPDFEISIQRERAFYHGLNLLGLRYSLVAKHAIKIRIWPLFNVRDHHDTLPIVMKDYAFGYQKENQLLRMAHPLIVTKLKTDLPFTMAVKTWEDSPYAIETERGYPDLENQLSPGYYTLTVEGNNATSMDFVIADDSINTIQDVSSILEAERSRLADLCSRAQGIPEAMVSLIYAADQFIVKRHTTGKSTILAGYPWFTDWGRDTMISIPGLCLATGRSELALEMIETFLLHSFEGVIPNNFPDQGEQPMYNTVDGTLWLFQAFYSYWLATKDQEALERLYPTMSKIIQHHQDGTINNIRVDKDGLLASGDQTTQLTWMDVKVNGWVVTPRHDKAVEINALYYNALSIMAHFSEMLEKTDKAKQYQALAGQLSTRFHEVFWNPEKGYLNDLYMDGEAWSMIRPNMLFAISLPFPVLKQALWKPVVDTCTSHLYFDYGLRSLSFEDPEYCGLYKGDLLARDGAYHRGTGWGWLLGPYLEAHYKTYQDSDWIKGAIEKALAHLEEGALGTFAENFDGDKPHSPRGCCAQAWSVAELLRVSGLVYHLRG